MNRSSGIYNLINEKEINASIKRVIDSNINFNTYLTTKGLKELRLKIISILNDLWSQKLNYKNILITTSSQQSINLIVDALLEENDTIIVEQPTYFGALDIFKKRKINIIGLNVEKDGFNLDELEKKIKRYHPKMIYATPTFNNPTGYSWSNQNRNKFLKVINKYNVLVLEDDPYSYINFTNEKYYSLTGLNSQKNIIYLGTFSKLISPSINVGYIIAEKNLIDKIYLYKKSYDLSTSAFLQYVILDYLNNYDLKEIINKKINNYKELLNKSLKYLKEEYRDKIISYTDTKGGLFYLVKFNEEVDKNIFESGNNYYIDNGHEKETRINICSFM